MNVRTRLGRLGIAGAVALAATGIAVAAAATPANAAVFSNANAAAAGTVAASAVVFCPGGQFLSGGGGWIAGGNGDVTLTDIIPDLAAQSVTVWGHSNPGAAPAAYTVIAQAICVAGAVPANYQLVSSPSANNGVGLKTQTALCPAGTNLLGMGAQHNFANGEAFFQTIEPNAALTAATVTSAASGGFAGPWQLITHAICATLPAGLVGNVVNAVSGFNSNSPKFSPGAVCPAGSMTTGVGGTVSPAAAGNVILTRITANAAQDTAIAGADEDGGFAPAWSVIGRNICWG